MLSQRDAELYEALCEAKRELTEALYKHDKALKVAREALQECASIVNWNRREFLPIGLSGWPLPDQGEPWKMAENALHAIAAIDDRL